MQIIPVSGRNSTEFARYCRRYGPEHDPSYTVIDRFEPSPDRPAYLLEEDGETAGAVSLLISPEYYAARRARFILAKLYYSGRSRRLNKKMPPP